MTQNNYSNIVLEKQGEARMKDYKAVIIAREQTSGVLFAKRSNSEEETKTILGDELLRLLSISEGDVSFSTGKDDFENDVIEARYDYNLNSLEYTIYLEQMGLGEDPSEEEVKRD